MSNQLVVSRVVFAVLQMVSSNDLDLAHILFTLPLEKIYFLQQLSLMVLERSQPRTAHVGTIQVQADNVLPVVQRIRLRCVLFPQFLQGLFS